ncbi:hypothetical protein V8C40DRAFT_133187 [Trichoderma camerunense]
MARMLEIWSSTPPRQGKAQGARLDGSFPLVWTERGCCWRMDRWIPPGLRDERRSNGPPSSSPCGLRCVSRDHVYERYRRQRERLFFFSTTRPARFPRSGHRRAITSYTHEWACQNHKEIWVCALLGRRCGLRPEKQAGLIHDNERAELRERNRRRKSHVLYVASMALGGTWHLFGQDLFPSNSMAYMEPITDGITRETACLWPVVDCKQNVSFRAKRLFGPTTFE